MGQTGEPLIELIDADVPRIDSIASSPLIRDVRWAISRNEFWAVGAQPGAGKTDLLATAGGLQRPLKGFHLLFGKNIDQMDEHEIVVSHMRVGIVFANGRLFSHLTVEENVQLALAYHRDAPRNEIAHRVEETLEVTQLTDIRNRLPNQITRNLHQRAGLARALALRPEVLLIDNPLAGIDPRQGRWWLNFLCQLTAGHSAFDKKPITIVTASDDLRPWLDVARQFAVVRNHKLETIGGSAETRASDDPAVKDLLMPPFAE